MSENETYESQIEITHDYIRARLKELEKEAE